ncbi:MAG: hypothetical protein ACPHCI_08510 [Solirubrobacterales bacterium]
MVFEDVLRRAAAVFLACGVILVLAFSSVGHAAKKSRISGTYKGTATATQGSTKYGSTKFVISKNRLKNFAINKVPIDCGVRIDLMNFGFTVANNVLKAYGLKTRNIKLSRSGRLKFNFVQPGSYDRTYVNVKFRKRSASGTVVRKPGPGELRSSNCSGSAKFKLKR